MNNRWLWAGKAPFIPCNRCILGIVVHCKILIETWHSRLSSVAISIWAYFRHHNSIMWDFSNDELSSWGFQTSLLELRTAAWLQLVRLDDPWWTKMDPQSYEKTPVVGLPGEFVHVETLPFQEWSLRRGHRSTVTLSDTSTSLISIGQAIWPILAIWPLAGLFMSFRFWIFAFLHEIWNYAALSFCCHGLCSEWVFVRFESSKWSGVQ